MSKQGVAPWRDDFQRKFISLTNQALTHSVFEDSPRMCVCGSDSSRVPEPFLAGCFEIDLSGLRAQQRMFM